MRDWTRWRGPCAPFPRRTRAGSVIPWVRASHLRAGHGEGRGPVAPPVFKTGLSLLVGDGMFDSFPSPPFSFPRRGRPALDPDRASDTAVSAALMRAAHQLL